VSQQSQDTLAIKTEEGKKVAFEKTLKKPLTQPTSKEAEIVGEQKEEMSKPLIEPSVENTLSQTSEIKEEKQTPTSESKPPLESMLSSTSEKKSETEKEDLSSGVKKNVLLEDIWVNGKNVLVFPC